jgi:very-short-patch-repair endonuclease
MHFGPLNLSGGERRLNVAITRARRLLRVFSTISHTEIDPMKTRAKGALHLREFLRYAEEQGSESLEAVGIPSQEHDSEFEREVSDALALLGFDVDAQVGCSGYRIDLGVRHPKNRGVFVLGVECDGAPYHSGATARDRDRLRQSVLEGLSWRLHRIWSTDWWFNREREVEKLREAVERAIAQHDRAAADAASAAVVEEGDADAVAPDARDVSLAGAPPGAETPRVASDGADASPEHVSDARATAIEVEADSSGASVEMPPVEVYERAQLTTASREPEDIFQPRFRNAIRSRIIDVVRVEGPVHRDAIAKAVTGAFGVQRMSERFRRTVVTEVERLGAEGLLKVLGDFAWPTGMDVKAYARIRGADARDPTDRRDPD